MSNYEKRTNEWVGKFLKFIDENHPDLLMHFYSKIFFSPAVDNPDVLYAAYTPLEDTPELKRTRERMFLVFDEFYRQNPV